MIKFRRFIHCMGQSIGQSPTVENTNIYNIYYNSVHTLIRLAIHAQYNNYVILPSDIYNFLLFTGVDRVLQSTYGRRCCIPTGWRAGNGCAIRETANDRMRSIRFLLYRRKKNVKKAKQYVTN